MAQGELYGETRTKLPNEGAEREMKSAQPVTDFEIDQQN